MRKKMVKQDTESLKMCIEGVNYPYALRMAEERSGDRIS